MPITRDDLLSVEEVAAITEYSTSALNRWRSQGNGGPPYIRVGGGIVYVREEVERWAEENPRWK